jgi:hypothetical protein
MNNDIRLPKNSKVLLATISAVPSLVTSVIKPRHSAEASIHMAQTRSWGRLPALSLVSAVGLLLVATADTFSRSGVGQYEFLFWVGLLMVIVPIAARLASSEPSRRERIGLVVLIGLGFYLVKVMHSPYQFTFADEMVHAYNADQIVQTGTLFNVNPILSVTPLYPGLETVTAALASLSGLSVFGAGLIVVGAGRLILVLALYLFYEEMSGSARLAGVATLLYAATANYLFFSVEFSYESISLPLAAFVLFVVVRRAAAYKSAHHRTLTLIALLGIVTIVITHHLTSYFLALFFIVWFVLLLLVRLIATLRASTKRASGGRRRWKIFAFIDRMTRPGLQPASTHIASERYRGLRALSEPAVLAIIATIACLVWLIGVANLTVGYLSPVLGGAITSIIQTIAGEANTRQLFQSTTGYVAPLWERLMGISAILLMLLGVPFGLRRIWQHFRGHPITMVLAGAALLYFAMLGLRFVPAAWETGNRASEFLFIGLSFVLACAVMELWNLRHAPWLSRIIILCSVAIIFMGGVIAGWPPLLRLSKTVQVTVDNVMIEPQGYAAAGWMRATLGKNNRVATDDSNARLMLTYGEQIPFTGRNPDIKDLLGTPDIPAWEVELMQDNQIQYIAFDRRLISWDNMEGYYFDETGGSPIADTALIDPEVYGKFDKPTNVNRIFDSGNIVIYDVKAMSDVTSSK